MTIDDYIQHTQVLSKMPSTSGLLYSNLRENIDEFLVCNEDVLGKVNLTLFKSPRSISEVVTLNGVDHVIYNCFCGDFAKTIHYLATVEFQPQNFKKVYFMEKLIHPLLGGLIVPAMFLGSEFADKSASITELFILYHETGHIAKARGYSFGNVIDIHKYIEIAKQDAKQHYEDKLHRMVKGGASEYAVLMTLKEHADALALYDSDALYEEVFCDIFSATTVAETYRNMDEDTNAMLCGMSLLTYLIVAKLLNAIDFLVTGQKGEGEGAVKLFELRAQVFLIFLSQETSIGNKIEFLEHYLSLEAELNEVVSLLANFAGDVEQVKKAIIDYVVDNES